MPKMMTTITSLRHAPFVSAARQVKFHFVAPAKVVGRGFTTLRCSSMAAQNAFDVYVKGTGPDSKELGDCKLFSELRLCALLIQIGPSIRYALSKRGVQPCDGRDHPSVVPCSDSIMGMN